MPSVVNSEKLGEFLTLLIHVIKYNAAYQDEEVVAGIVKSELGNFVHFILIRCLEKIMLNVDQVC